MAEVRWISAEDARRALGGNGEMIGERTLDRMRENGEVVSRMETRPGRRPERMYDAGSIERARHDRNGGSGAMVPHGTSAVPGAAWFTRMDELLLKLLAGQQQQQQKLLDEGPARPMVELRDKLWLTHKEASIYSGLTLRFIRKLARECKLVAIRGRIQRVSLEAWCPECDRD